MKEKIKEYKRKLLKNIQAKLLWFLNTEYRTPQEIQKDPMDFYVSGLEKTFPLRFKDDNSTMSQYIGDITYLKSKDGNTYYKNHKTGDWIDSSNGENITEQQLKELKEKLWTNSQTRKAIMTENKRIIYIDVATEDIHTFYLLDKKYKLVRQILDQVEKKKI